MHGMLPTSTIGRGDEYQSQGQIVQELRTLARNYSIPIVTITQNVRSSENYEQSLNNQMIGDSIKKVRYADYIYMLRQRFDLDFLSEQVKNDVMNTTGTNTFSLSMADVGSSEFKQLIPFEIKITKAKEGKKDISKFHLFNGGNLRVCDSLSEFFSDLPQFNKVNKNLNDQINLLNSVLIHTEMGESTDLLI
jgi:hypothetical protein